MGKLFVIIWVSTWSKAEGVVSGVYYDAFTAEKDKNKLNLSDTTRVFHVVEYEGKEHKNAIMCGGTNPF